jgi:hypothetical protein
VGPGRVELLRHLVLDLRRHTVLLALGGSRAYGLHTDDSDVDLKGVAIPPAAHFHGFLSRFEQAEGPDAMAVFLPDLTPGERQAAARSKVEGTVYEIRKLLRLASDANPNVLDLLFCRDEDVRTARPAGATTRANRRLFLSLRCRDTFTGYANAQLKRLRNRHDAKDASHLVRLLRMGREILETGEVHVWRGDRDADELRAIRDGSWSVDRILAEADAEQSRIAALAERAAVPPAPDLAAIDRLCVDLVEASFRA